MEEQALKDAQYRKSLSIAYFNSVNSAIELVTKSSLVTGGLVFGNSEDIRSAIEVWRDWFLEEHKAHYLKTVAQVGTTYDKQKAIDRLKETKEKSELQKVWVALSEDERRDGDIRKVCNELLKEYDPA